MAEYMKLPLDENGNLIKNNWRFQSPEELVIVSWPKSGKTFNMVNVKGFLLGDSEGGTNYFAASNVANLLDYSGKKAFVKIKSGAYVPAGVFETVDECSKANRMKEYWELRNKLDQRLPEKEKEKIFLDLVAMVNNMPFPVYVSDTITSLQELNARAALAEYNDRFPNKPKEDIKKADEYGGVQYIRNNFAGIKRFIELNAAPFKIWCGHIRENKKTMKKTQEEINVVDIALDGLLSTTFTAKASAVCVFNRTDDGCFLDFQKREETDLGSRPRHLSNKLIRIADILEEGQMYPKTYWQNVFPELKF